MNRLKPDQLLQALQLAEIYRWARVPLLRQQTVAEHSYRVWLLSTDLYLAMSGDVPHNSFELLNLQMYALTHDLAEVVTGDIPADFKDAIRKKVPGMIEGLESKALAEVHPDAASLMRQVHDSFEYQLVTLCDNVEALIYFGKYATPRNIVDVPGRSITKIAQLLEEGVTKFPGRDWAKAADWLEDLGIFTAPGSEEEQPIKGWDKGSPTGGNGLGMVSPGQPGLIVDESTDPED